MAIGNVGTYATLQPVQGDPIGKALDTVEQNAFKYREEEAAKAKLAKEGEEKRLQDIDEMKVDFNFDVSGYNGVDGPIYGIALKGREDVADLQTKMIENPNMSQVEKANIKQRIQKYDQTFKYLKQFAPMLKTHMDEVTKGIKEGKYFDGDIKKLEKELGQFESGNYELFIGKNNDPTVVIYDTNEKGERVGVLKQTPLGNFINSLTPRKNFDYNAFMKGSTEGIKATTVSRQTGSNITEKQQITPDIVRSANSAAEYIMSDPDTRSIMEEQFGTEGDALKQKVVNDFLARIETKDLQKLDTGFLNYARGVQKDQEEQATFGVVETPPEFASSGVKSAKGYKTVSVTGSKPLTRVGDYNLATLDAYTVEKMPNGQRSVTAVINYPIIKTSTLSAEEQLTFKKANSGQKLNEDEQLTLDKITKGAEYGKKVVRLTEKEAYKFAKQMGLPDVNAMKDATYVGGEDAQKQSTTIQFDAKGNIIE